MASYQARQRDPLLDQNMQAMLERRARELARSGVQDARLEQFRWQLEELRVSLFAQELGTAEPVSAVKLDRALAALQPGAQARSGPAVAAVAATKPILAVPLAEKKSVPLKNLNALDKLFGR